MPTHWVFYFQRSGLPLSVSEFWSGSMCRAHIALQELQAVAMVLCKMAFCLCDKVVALHLDNSKAKAYLCNQGGTVSPFLSRLACEILSLTDKHGITLIPAYIPTYLNVEAHCLSLGGCLLSGIFFLRWFRQLFTFGAFQRWTHGHLLIPLNASIITHWNLHYCWGLRVECLQPSVAISGRLHVSSSSISSSGSVQVSGRTCQRSTQTIDSGGTMFDRGSLASHSSQHVGRHSLAVLHHKRSHCVLKGLPYLHLTLWLLSNVCFTDRVLFLGLSWATWVSTSKVYQQCWKEWPGWCSQQGVPNNAISGPKLASFWYIYFRLAWPSIPLVYIILLFLLFWSLIIFTRLLIILSFQN